MGDKRKTTVNEMGDKRKTVNETGDKRKTVHETTKPSGVNMSTASYRSTQAPQAQHLPATSRVNRTPHSASSAQSSSSTQEAGNSNSSATSSRITNPFVSNPHGHPSFNPVKLGAKGAGDSKTPKQPKPPDKPLMPYLRYSRKVWDSVKASNPDLKLWEIGKIIGQMWRELSDEEKQEFVDEYDMEKIQYADAMKAYHNSPAYQAWIAAKGKADVMTEPEEPEKTRRSKALASHQAEPKMVNIPPPDDEDDLDDTPSVKHIASLRYHRNHCLINDIFSDAIVPDGRTVINESRMTVLKRQVQSLTVHQKKLEGELQQLEEKHKAKKFKFAESSEEFYQEYRRLCESKPQITDEQFAAMVQQAKEEQREKQKNTVAPKEPETLPLAQADQRENVDEKLPLKEEEHSSSMETSETVLLTKPPSVEHGCSTTEALMNEEKPTEKMDETMSSEPQLNTNLKEQIADCPHNQDSIPEKTETNPVPVAAENAMSWKEQLTAEADSAAILSDITEDSIDGTSTDDSSKKTQQ